jgi:hypothetical protein
MSAWHQRTRQPTVLAENVLRLHDPLLQLVHLHGDVCRMAYRAPVRSSQPPELSCQRAAALALITPSAPTVMELLHKSHGSLPIDAEGPFGQSGAAGGRAEARSERL